MDCAAFDKWNIVLTNSMFVSIQVGPGSTFDGN